MKLWVKYLIASALGIFIGFIVPLNGGDTQVFLQSVYTYILHIGRYLVFPLVFFGLTIGTYELWHEKKFFQVYGKTALYIVLTAVSAALIGALFVVIFSPERVPIIIEETQVRPLPSIAEQFFMVFPRNLFSVFSTGGDFLLPVTVLAVLLGFGLVRSKSFAVPVIDVFESLSRIIYNMNRIVLEILSVGLFVMMVYRMTQLRELADLELFAQLIFLIIGAIVFTCFVLLPLLLYFFGGTRKPYRWLFAVVPAAISGLLSGDLYFTISSAEGVVNQNMGIPRKAGSAMIPLGVIFSRSGTAMLTAMSFFLILRSYSSLNITIMQFFWIVGSSIVISFMLGTVPGNGMIVSLSLISAWYGQGLEEGFLILLPIAPILTTTAVLLDTIVMLFTVQMASHREGLGEIVRPREFL